jgi:hypothetical protein
MKRTGTEAINRIMDGIERDDKLVREVVKNMKGMQRLHLAIKKKRLPATAPLSTPDVAPGK